MQFELMLDGVDPQEYDGVLQALREKKKFVRLTDGSFLSLLPDDGWSELAGYLDEVGEIKGGVVEGIAYDAKGIGAIAAIPSREELLSKLLGSIQSPITNFARVMNQLAEKGGAGAVEAAPAEEAPAAEEAAPAEEAPAAE